MKRRYNGSVHSHHGKWVLAARESKQLEGWPSIITLWDLEIKTATATNRRTLNLMEHSELAYPSDPMLYSLGDELNCAYVAEAERHVSTRQATARIDFHGNILADVTLNNYGSVYQKSWMFFEHCGSAFAVYAPSPDHIVIRLGTDEKWTTPGLIWGFGEIHGSSQPVLFDDRYFTIVHSWFMHNGRREYVAGWYSFKSKPPFDVLEWSAKPLIVHDPKEVNGSEHSTVFPRGLARHEGKWLISYGYFDRETRLLEVELLDRTNPMEQGQRVMFEE